ncbi:lycopene beta cyclase [Nodosilinea sp. P-1105]|uniref:lycopene beta cyclase n=1 Tax=Nodosilinea sp. P-1105 TaxID=2546229 RepID=UPI00146C1865|nr:lycopene cyclase family protein [Nodosilinea sp. P-1105]NMF82449.1 lycopene cyclase family protein [Nodosilinea sp. P-1105]
MLDVLVIGAGPAGLFMAVTLGQAGLAVQGVAPHAPTRPWPNTYGIWADELEDLGLTQFLSHRWKDCVVHVRDRTLPLHRDYGLIDKDRLQSHWLDQMAQHHTHWHQGMVTQVDHTPTHSSVTLDGGETLTARLVLDATGHQAALVQRPATDAIAYQAAYGIVGRFSSPPIQPNQMVLMDYRDDHLSAAERRAPPTFLYAMDLGDNIYFMEETSLAHHPAISMDVLERRLYQRLHHRGVQVTEKHHVERCLFPMNLPLPRLDQPVVGFGGAASMVHPASGYMFGALLRRGPAMAEAIAHSIKANSTSTQVAQAAWQALWPQQRLRKHYLYRFGLENLMAFDAPQLNQFFKTFFSLDTPDWSGFLADTMTLPELVRAMLGLFSQAPNPVRWGLMRSVATHGQWLKQAFF